MLRFSKVLAFGVLVSVGLQGCSQSTSSAGGPKPTAVASIEILTNPSSRPDSQYVATCQTGAIVRLIASGSSDPSGRQLAYRWTDRLGGELTPDFGPGRNPMETGEETVGVLFASIGVHDVELQVTSSSGAKASTAIQVLVTSCEDCGGP